MPHVRSRHLRPLLEKSLQFSPISGILGHRQVGKTTLASQLADRYLTLDQGAVLAQALADPNTLLARNIGSPLVIDECQLSPPLFPALKEWVRTRKSPGQFLLTGSVRFSSRKAIRESLTGRIVAWELLPMDWSEIHGDPLADKVPSLISGKSLGRPLARHPRFSEGSYKKFFDTGGLPGVFAVRDPGIRAQRFETQINTMLERDLRLLVETSLSYRSLRELLRALSFQAGAPLSVAELRRHTRISLPTLRKLLGAFEALFLIRLVPSEGDYSKPVLFFEDLGEQQFLSKAAAMSSSESRLLLFLYHHLRAQAHYRPEKRIEISCYRDRSMAGSALLFRSKEGVLGVFPCADEADVSVSHEHASRFLKLYSDAKAIIVTVEDQDQLLSPRVRWVGAGRLL